LGPGVRRYLEGLVDLRVPAGLALLEGQPALVAVSIPHRPRPTARRAEPNKKMWFGASDVSNRSA
jgi:hypothetical protein